MPANLIVIDVILIIINMLVLAEKSALILHTRKMVNAMLALPSVKIVKVQISARVVVVIIYCKLRNVSPSVALEHFWLVVKAV